MKPAKHRLYVEENLGQGQAVSLSREAAHYLFNVMRLRVGDHVRIFNGRDGEWRADVAVAEKRGGQLTVVAQLRVQSPCPDLWLVFAPLKKARMDMIVEKAVELGVSRLCPVTTAHSNSERIRPERIEAQIREAAEQCERLDLPDLAPLCRLEACLGDWDAERRLFFADERGEAAPAFDVFAQHQGPAAVLIGPEGGFSAEESANLRSKQFVAPVSLGPRILRAETAASAALTLRQAAAGDWSDPR